MSDTPTITLTQEERDYLWFMPQVPGGKEVPERLQQRYAELGLVVRNAEGQYWPTLLGDQVRRGAVPVTIVD